MVDVRVYDVDDLVEWLQTHPPVHAWATKRVRGHVQAIALSRPNELPALPLSVSERAELESQVEGATTRSATTSIWGGPGMGKSTLACVVARRIEDRYPDGVFFASIDSPDHESGEVAALQRRVIDHLGRSTPSNDLDVDYRHAVAGKGSSLSSTTSPRKPRYAPCKPMAHIASVQVAVASAASVRRYTSRQGR